MADRRVRRCGDHGVLVEMDSGETVLALAVALAARPVPGQIELVPGADTLLIVVDGDLETAAADTASRPVSVPIDPGGADTASVEIDVCYDGADLAEVGELTGLGAAGVVAAHSGQTWTVAFGGFAPGFGYLVGDGRLTVPRRRTPRTAVPAGAVGLAGPYSGSYPRESPGGWQLIGRTAAPLWDLDREPPALLRPGMSVRFRAVETLPEPVPADVRPARSGPITHGLEVVRPGILTTVQDLGRPGHAAEGVTCSGAADRDAHRRSNLLVGNEIGAATLETTLGGLRVRAVGDHLVAVTGAPVPLVIRHADGSATTPTPGAFSLRDGDVLELGTATAGLRSYLSVRGGIDEPAVLGSRSTDLLSGLGPAPLTQGRVLPVGTAAGRPDPAAVSGLPVDPVLTVTPGPHLDRLAPDAWSVLTGQTWQVTPQSNRVGLRLAGEPVGTGAGGELPSTALVPGAIQVPPSGLPVVFLRDHPTTGGYPVAAVLTDDAIDRAAQLRPGQPVRFAAVDPG